MPPLRETGRFIPSTRPFRDLDDDKRFHKYQWIKVSARKAKDDSRPETVRPDFSTIEIASEVLPTTNNWAARYQFLKPLQAASLCDIQDAQERDRTSLGFFRPKEILGPDEDPRLGACRTLA